MSICRDGPATPDVFSEEVSGPVQERLGHSSIAITMDTYSHVIDGLQREAAQKFDAQFAEV